MDHARLMRRLQSANTIELAFEYAIRDRLTNDYFFNPFEIEYAMVNKQAVLDELREELSEPGEYTTKTAFAFFPPKNEHCYRRMVYIPLKDLVLRYAYVIIISDILETELCATCFANRRARGKRAEFTLLEDFAETSWPDFCRWQRENARKYNHLLRTDITSFYDSISHGYLVDGVIRALAVDRETPFIKLFRRLLRFPVISYFSSATSVSDIRSMRMMQGLPIGNNTEGYLANVYLSDVDAVMSKLDGIAFARYNDDMRIFAHSVREANAAVLVLQKHLLSRGLNLNSSKTEFAEGAGVEKLRSKDYDVFEYGLEEETLAAPRPAVEDSPFDEFDPTKIKLRMRSTGIKEAKDAKDLCRWLNHQTDGKLIKLRTPDDVDTLVSILERWHGSAKFAAWLLVQSGFWDTMRPNTKNRAREAIFEILRSDDASSYAKYRILHHLVKRRDSGLRYLSQMTGETKRLRKVLESLVGEHAFELNLISLYVFRALGFKVRQLRDIANRLIPEPLGEPIKTALFGLADEIRPSTKPLPSDGIEPDSRPEQY